MRHSVNQPTCPNSHSKLLNSINFCPNVKGSVDRLRRSWVVSRSSWETEAGLGKAIQGEPGF
eukprot:m.153064 g.153064  ORF g.153064 m.153064 type:complete len:62 (+) comp38618_c2_seq2:440-625(+)